MMNRYQRDRSRSHEQAIYGHGETMDKVGTWYRVVREESLLRDPWRSAP